MGLLGKLFGTERARHPALDPSDPAAERIERNKTTLEAFAGKVRDKLEVVPGARALYVFIGRPPDAFGIAWFEGSEEHNLKRLMTDRKLSQAKVQAISDELRNAYQRAREEPRYVYALGGKNITVTPSPALEAELVRIIHVVAD